MELHVVTHAFGIEVRALPGTPCASKAPSWDGTRRRRAPTQRGRFAWCCVRLRPLPPPPWSGPPQVKDFRAYMRAAIKQLLNVTRDEHLDTRLPRVYVYDKYIPDSM